MKPEVTSLLVGLVLVGCGIRFLKDRVRYARNRYRPFRFPALAKKRFNPFVYWLIVFIGN